MSHPWYRVSFECLAKICKKKYTLEKVFKILFTKIFLNLKKKSFLNRLMLSHGVACVSICYPITSFTDKCRLNVYISTAHTRTTLDYVLNAMEKYANEFGT